MSVIWRKLENPKEMQRKTRAFVGGHFHISSDSCLPQSDIRSLNPCAEAPLPRTNPSLNAARFLTHHHHVLLITQTKPASRQTSCRIFCRHINKSSTILHHHYPRRHHHHQRLLNIGMHGHQVGKVQYVSIEKISTATRSVSDPEAKARKSNNKSRNVIVCLDICYHLPHDVL